MSVLRNQYLQITKALDDLDHRIKTRSKYMPPEMVRRMVQDWEKLYLKKRAIREQLIAVEEKDPSIFGVVDPETGLIY